MYLRDLPSSVETRVWPVGIDTERWSPGESPVAGDRVIVYDKILWNQAHERDTLVTPIVAALTSRGYRVSLLRYGSYRESLFESELKTASFMVFLCEHETQGIAYQQALSSGVPILAWDRKGLWTDPSYYPAITFGPVSSVPYFDSRCGLRFSGLEEFRELLPAFLERLNNGEYRPRDFVLERLRLEDRAKAYLDIVEEVETELGL